jgi:hypothetical protein
VACWRNYPERTPTSKIGDQILIFEDTDGDGKADKQTEFIGDLNAPTGFQFYKDGVLIMQAPSLLFVRDTDGDGKADWQERILMGMDSADSHHTANAICYEPGGAIYLSDGVFHRTQVETADGVLRNNDAAIFALNHAPAAFLLTSHMDSQIPTAAFSITGATISSPMRQAITRISGRRSAVTSIIPRSMRT